MRVISLRNVINTVWNKKILLFLSVIVFALLGTALGYKQTKQTIINRQAEADIFQQDIIEYETSIQTLETNLETIKQQYSKQKEYCENSIYMKINSNAFYMGEVQYSVPDSNNNSLRDTIAAYFGSNEFRNKVVEKIGDVNAGYFKEVYFVNASGNMITIDVAHYEEDQAKKYLEAVVECVDEAGYETVKLNSSVSVRTDSAVLNVQNTQNTNLKTYATNVTDIQNSLSNKIQEKDKFVQENAVYPMDKKSKIVNIIKFTLVGVILGIVAMFAGVVLKILYGSKLESEDYLEQNGIVIIGDYNNKDANNERVALDIDLVLSRENVKTVCVSTLTSATDGQKELSSLVAELKNYGRETIIDNTGLEDVGNLKKFVQAGNAVVVVRYKDTRYDRLEKYIKMCERYDIKLIGAIII